MYANSKNLGDRRWEKKRPFEFALPQEAWASMLAACERQRDINPLWKRDHAAIFLGGALGLRVGETCLLERKNFRDLSEHDIVYLPTLKQSERIPFACLHVDADGKPCGRKCRVRHDRVDTDHNCPRCGKPSKVPRPKGKIHTGILEVPVEIVESQTANYILDFVENHMRPDQRWLFEGRGQDDHMVDRSMGRVFNTYVLEAGLNPKLSYHSLRHLRGVRVWSMLKDMKAVQHALRHKNIAASQIYADIDADKKRAYREALEDGALDPLKKKRDH